MRRTRYVSRGTRRPRRKIVFARGAQSVQNQVAGTVDVRTNVLSEFETAYGAQLLGATIMRIRGTVSVRNRSTVTTGTSTFSWGWWHTTVSPTDLGSSHPNPDVVNTNDDKFGSWMWWDAFTTFPALGAAVGDSQTDGPYRREFDVRSKRVLRNLEDNLLLCWATSSGGAQHDIGITYSIALALP